MELFGHKSKSLFGRFHLIILFWEGPIFLRLFSIFFLKTQKTEEESTMYWPQVEKWLWDRNYSQMWEWKGVSILNRRVLDISLFLQKGNWRECKYNISSGRSSTFLPFMDLGGCHEFIQWSPTPLLCAFDLCSCVFCLSVLELCVRYTRVQVPPA